MKLVFFILVILLDFLSNANIVKWERLTKTRKIQYPMYAPLTFDIINYINFMANTTWKAGYTYRFRSISDIKNVLGVLKDPKDFRLPEKKFGLRSVPLPTSFDARQKWPFCKSLAEIRDQSNCGSCWAFGAVEAMTDRYCIHSNGTKTPRISAENLLTCCGLTCGAGCNGGFPPMAWFYWYMFGIVTGGSYATNVGCQDYAFPSCSHHNNGPYPPCTGNRHTPPCMKACQDHYNKTYAEDKHYGHFPYVILRNEERTMEEIMTNGPVEASFSVYADFPNYQSGVYQHVSGAYLGGHAVKIIGWGVENGVKYWTVANSWNPTWGDLGFFKIRRGNNECGIENDIVAGLPKL